MNSHGAKLDITGVEIGEDARMDKETFGMNVNATARAVKQEDEHIGMRGDVKITVFDEDGNFIHVQKFRNLVLDTGLTIWPLILNGTKTPTIASIEVGSSTVPPAVGQTGVITILATDAAPIKEVVGASITYHGLVTGISDTINEVALKIDSVGVARQLVSPGIIMTAVRRATVEWTFTFGRAA